MFLNELGEKERVVSIGNIVIFRVCVFEKQFSSNLIVFSFGKSIFKEQNKAKQTCYH